MRTVTDRNGRSYSVTETSTRPFNAPPYRRRTVVGVSDELQTAQNRVNRNQHDPNNVYRGSIFQTAPIYRKGGGMSKVVRNVKNITKGYSGVQVKVRNGRLPRNTLRCDDGLRCRQLPPTTHGARRAQIWLRLLPSHSTSKSFTPEPRNHR